MILDCWRQDRDERPSFQELVERLEQLMLQEVEYFDLTKWMNRKIIIMCRRQRKLMTTLRMTTSNKQTLICKHNQDDESVHVIYMVVNKQARGPDVQVLACCNVADRDEVEVFI
ncbi:hypothetical protein OS493_017472 [Desmophyllum pertusum]|uniref:Uncharacterized protein n=1 Tax=Desmophyllum pertusum TaxID=174260 RepID=A0A9W9ZSC4_9CNID|nr:hypothetical protein OS493_017472 [Desmophyllum pertusum]